MAKQNSIETINNNIVAVKAYEYLWKQGLIVPGKVIKGEDIEKAVDCTYKPDDWKFLGRFMALQVKLKSEGYFVNQKRLEAPSLRIIASEDMAELGQKRIMEAVAYNFETAYVMSAHDVSSLSDDQQKKHRKIQQKAAQAALLQQKILLDNEYF